MTNPTDRETFHYTAGTLNPGMPPTEIGLLSTVLKLLAGKTGQSDYVFANHRMAAKHIYWAIERLEEAEKEEATK